MPQHTAGAQRVDPDGREYGIDEHLRAAVVPHRFNVVSFAAAIPGFLEHFEEVPADRWRRYKGTARIKCACQGDTELPPSERPAVTAGGLLGCEHCDLVYLYTGRAVLVAEAAPREQVAA